MVEWTTSYRPQSLDEMALYPALRKRLNYYLKRKDLSHLIMQGDTGTGKTTSARILADAHEFDVREIDCSHINSSSAMLDIIKGSTSVSLFGAGKRKLFLMDEFHNVDKKFQTMFNKTMEDQAAQNIYVFCVNKLNDVAEPIISRCSTLYFDVGVIHPTTHKFKMFPYADISKDEWIDELKRVGRLVASKDGHKDVDAQLDAVAANDPYILDPRRFIRALKEQIEMHEMEN